LRDGPRWSFMVFIGKIRIKQDNDAIIVKTTQLIKKRRNKSENDAINKKTTQSLSTDGPSKHKSPL
jgi:hypothetical protein